MAQYRFKTNYKKLLADTVTPVGIFLKVRDKFANSILLESSDYHSNDNSYSYICCNPVSKFEVSGGEIQIKYPDGKTTTTNVSYKGQVIEELQKYILSFETEKNPFAFSNNGLFGYMTYDSIRYFEDVEIKDYEDDERRIPEIFYQIYQYIIVINHFKDELYIFEHSLEGSENGISQIETLINNKKLRLL